jgi:hypothetical protein
MSRMSENVGASTSRNLKGLHGLYGDNFTFYLTAAEGPSKLPVLLDPLPFKGRIVDADSIVTVVLKLRPSVHRP